MVLIYYLQNSYLQDYTKMITTFIKRLLARGHELEIVQKLINEASQHILSIMPSHKIYVRNKKQMTNNISDTIYFHELK